MSLAPKDKGSLETKIDILDDIMKKSNYTILNNIFSKFNKVNKKNLTKVVLESMRNTSKILS